MATELGGLNGPVSVVLDAIQPQRNVVPMVEQRCEFGSTEEENDTVYAMQFMLENEVSIKIFTKSSNGFSVDIIIKNMHDWK